MSQAVYEVPPATTGTLEVLGVQEPPIGIVGQLCAVALEKPGVSPLLSPALEINPIGAAYRPVSRIASFGLSTAVWGVLGAAGFFAYRLEVPKAPAPFSAESVAFQVNETENLTQDGGGHQGGGLPPPRAAEQDPAQPPPPPPRDLPTDAPVPSALPTEPSFAPPAPLTLGVAGGTGTGNGYGTGSGSGTGTGSGTGSGNGTGDGIQSSTAPVIVPYSQIGFLKVVNPDYPERARRVGLQGQVVVRVTIDENGVPYEFQVLGGEDLFVKETLKVLPRWRFTPVTHLGKKVKATFDAVLRFNLA